MELLSTPGPWEIIQYGHAIICSKILGITKGEDFNIEVARFMVANTPDKREECKANAKLIAAAPEMLDALIESRNLVCRLCIRLNPQHKNCTSCDEVESGFDKIIEKATGQKIEDILK